MSIENPSDTPAITESTAAERRDDLVLAECLAPEQQRGRV